MKIEHIKEIADAVLYEGYLLYPYRRSAIKNRQRWTFGVVYPHAYSRTRCDTEPWKMQTECLLQGTKNTQLTISVRFLHLLLNSVVQYDHQSALSGQTSAIQRQIQDEWEEGVAREVVIAGIKLQNLLDQPVQEQIAFAGRYVSATTTDATIISSAREQQDICGLVCISASKVADAVYKLSISIENDTPQIGIDPGQREAVLLYSFISTHTILQIERGQFFSLLDPPAQLSEPARACQNLHTWPVLIGDAGEQNAMLSSPIILYDYPRIAPESIGSFFDGTEIDELLTLRMMTLTEDEKEELRHGDVRAREILERTESLSTEQFMKLHGVIRSYEWQQPAQEGKESYGESI
ncbi:hypothetical protein [Dictyobacter kobayashii]|uniref:Uncharacterized protein n=1 Tax=Dictyobacter kobayashii TaxID=2014872 RepID=A0A402AYV7_9CHLR|nr:hypothetical protein [Dictyobacter kobayashii]GCE24299.1 hypothetical protein KDK_80990 [Dictyobacter kobayashii]